jgi:VanZ family protein
LKNHYPLWAAFAWFIMTIVLLALPGSALPKQSWLSALWVDKWVHIGLFGILTLLWCRVLADKRKLRVFILIAAACLFYGLAMEFVQLYFITNRSFDMSDVVADGVGCIAGVLAALKLYPLRDARASRQG